MSTPSGSLPAAEDSGPYEEATAVELEAVPSGFRRSTRTSMVQTKRLSLVLPPRILTLPSV